MAASDEASVGGYRCEFLDSPHEHLFCQLCKRVSREATFITCCGENFCKGCITPVREAKQPCPICKAEEFSLNPNAKFDRQILSLRACCTLKERDCEWIGTVQDLDSHLSVETGDCQFVDVTCPNKCGQPIPRCEVPNHLQNECPKRDFFCQYCNFSGSHEVVCDQHYPECEYYPIPCPNGCSVVSIERGLLEDHLKMCPYHEVQCEYAHVGCQESFLREEMEKHMAENTQKHLALVSSVTAKLGQEFECRMGKMQEEFRGYLERREREVGEQLRQRDERIAGLEQKLQEKEKEFLKSQQKMKEEREDFKHQMGQLKKLEEKERQIQQQLQSQEQKLQHQLIQITAATKKIKILEQQVQACGKVDDFEHTIEITETKLQHDFKKEIDAREAALEKKIERDNERRTKEQNEMNAKTQAELQLSVEAGKRKIEEVERRLQTHDNAVFPHEHHLMLFPYQQLKGTKSGWYSSPMYTHPGGYKFCINVALAGGYSPIGSHITLYFCLLRGEFDGQLHWPVSISFTVNLLSNRDEKFPFTWKSSGRFSQVHSLSSFSKVGVFVPHKMVEDDNLSYDCLYFQVCNVRVN